MNILCEIDLGFQDKCAKKKRFFKDSQMTFAKSTNISRAWYFMHIYAYFMSKFNSRYIKLKHHLNYCLQINILFIMDLFFNFKLE